MIRPRAPATQEWLRRPCPELPAWPAGTTSSAAPAVRGHTIHSLLVAVAIGVAALTTGCERTQTAQSGQRGAGMAQLYKPSGLAATAAINRIPVPEAAEPPDPEAPEIKDVFKNVQVLNDLTLLEFARLMQALSTWVAPVEGCQYCHNPAKLESDEKYTKVVARRMLQMTRRINTEWKSHVAGTGVTCWTCHRGQAVPSGTWTTTPGPRTAAAFMGNRAGQNTGGVAVVGNSALPYDPLTAYLTSDNEVKVQGATALPMSRKREGTKQAEWTYSLMMYMSKSLGVNCTYCHNTQAMGVWSISRPQRVTAWHGIRMVRDLNTADIMPLQPLLPASRMGPTGDSPKLGCETCHKGSFKPLAGVSMLKDYPELAGVMVRPPAAPASTAAPAPESVVAAQK
jgi:photosynthetic reaction center cytochrome c subunit